MSVRHAIPQDVLRYLRERGRISQAAVAKAMKTVPSVLSKLQKVDEVEPRLAERYLEALGTELAGEVREFYSRPWKHEPPSFLHPDRDTLWLLDQAFGRLSNFEEGPQFHPILAGPVALLKNEMTATKQYLFRRDHSVAWVGDIGVGKTTALAHSVGLLVGDGRSQKRPAFPVGSGRTTICETEVRVSPTYGVAVEPYPEEETVKLTRELVASLAPNSTSGGVPAEVARAIRNMSDMLVKRVVGDDEEIQILDPIRQMRENGASEDETLDRVLAAMRLSERRERQALLPEGSLDGLNWLATLIARINNGQEPGFGIPRRITVMVPSMSLQAQGQVLSVVDTRGVEGTTQRPDLISHRDDLRTLVILCSKFADAPGQSSLRFIEETRSSGSDAISAGRLGLLVLPRADEALQLPGLDVPVASKAEGYALRKQEVSQALHKVNGSGIPIFFFDAHADAPDKVWSQIRGQINEMRSAYVARALGAVEGVDNLIENVDFARTEEARRQIEKSADQLFQFVSKLPDSIRAPHLNLLDQLDVTHPSSVAASMTREGDWDNFDVAAILGMGVRIDANKRTSSMIDRILNKLEEFELEHAELKDVVRSVKMVRRRVAEGRQEFLSEARSIGSEAYSSLLSGMDEVWNRAADRYGLGAGYKQDVAQYLREFFESDNEKHLAARKAVDKRLQKAWNVNVLDRLRGDTRAVSEEGGAAA